MNEKRVPLREDEHSLLTSLEGNAALHIFLPLIREFAIYIAGHGGLPQLKEGDIPELHSKARLERALCRKAGRCAE